MNDVMKQREGITRERAAALAWPIRDQPIVYELMNGNRIVYERAISTSKFSSVHINTVVNELKRFIEDNEFHCVSPSLIRGDIRGDGGQGFRADFRLEREGTSIDAILSFEGGAKGSTILLYFHKLDEEALSETRKGLNELAKTIGRILSEAQG